MAMLGIVPASALRRAGPAEASPGLSSAESPAAEVRAEPAPAPDNIIYGADGEPVGASKNPETLPTDGGIFYDSYASAYSHAQNTGVLPVFSDGQRRYALYPVEAGERTFYYAAEYDPQSGERKVELLEAPLAGAGATTEWLGSQMGDFIARRRSDPQAGPDYGASPAFKDSEGVENIPLNFAVENVREGESPEAASFREQLREVEAGTLPTHKILKLGNPSETLMELGVPDRPITLRQSVISKIIEKHGIGYDLISRLPESINDPIAVFSYPQDKNVRDVLVELRDRNGRAIVASLKLNVSTQRHGEVSDLKSVHPKENFGRIYDWIRKGKTLYWNKQKGRKFLQDSVPANWEQYETELSPLLLPSENYSESQGENLNFFADSRENSENEGRGAENYEGEPGGISRAEAASEAAKSIEAIFGKAAAADKERGIKKRRILRKVSDKAKLPKGVKLDKNTGRLAGLANPAEMRRYLAKALDVGVYPGMDVSRHRNAAGVYYNLLEIIRLRGGRINDMNVIGHELGHHLERLMFDYRLPDVGTPLKRELEGFCVSRFGKAYPPRLRAREGWAQFVSEWISSPREAERAAPIAAEAVSQLQRAFPKIGKILDNAREMAALWENAAPNAKAEANIKFADEARPAEGEGVSAFLKRLYGLGQYYGADRLYGLKRAQRIVNERTGEEADFYERARIMKGAASENSQWTLESRQTNIDGLEIGESLEEICSEKNTGVTLRRFEAYLVARRAMAYYERNPGESPETCRAKFGNDYATLFKVAEAATSKMRNAARRLGDQKRASRSSRILSSSAFARFLASASPAESSAFSWAKA